MIDTVTIEVTDTVIDAMTDMAIDTVTQTNAETGSQMVTVVSTGMMREIEAQTGTGPARRR